ncbi:MAG TPA: tetratricopeptide repeat protein [bacterium]|nr:tetratricopeptide repeat protein [bacterium]
MKKTMMTIVFISMVGLIGCEDEDMINENKELKAQVNDLKGQVAALEEENAKLKETADYHYQQGVDFQNAGDWNNAKIEFETVINKYPESELVLKAKSKLKETIDKLAEIIFNDAVGLIENEQWTQAKAKLEMLIESYPDSSYVGKSRSRINSIEYELRYIAKSEDEAIAEWKNFRNNENAMQGTITTWRVEVKYRKSHEYLGGGGNYLCSLEGNYSYPVLVRFEKSPNKGDWYKVTGKLWYVTDDGEVQFEDVEKLENIGYIEK